jgi:glycosyltransferase involved in cell wall biosynthesis
LSRNFALPNLCCKRDIRPERPELAVLVRIKNEIKALPEFWRRLSAQSCFERAEVIFLDSGSTDGTVEYLSSLPCVLYQMAAEDFRFGSSCNLVMSLSTAPVAVLLSGHVLLTEPNDLETICKLLGDNDSSAGYMRQVPNEHFGSSIYERAFLARRFRPSFKHVIELQHPGSFSNAASALTRDAWLANPFPDVNGSEDFLWAKQHLAAGRKLFYFPRVQVLHSHNETAQQVFKRVRLNVEARELGKSYGRAALYCGGVFAAMLRFGAKPAEAWTYALEHGKAYL